LTPSNFANKYNFNVGSIFFFFNNFLFYIAFIFLFISISIFSNLYFVFKQYKFSSVIFSLFLITSLIFVVFLKPSGEMNLGILSNLINSDLLNLIYGVSFFLSIFFFYTYFNIHYGKAIGIDKIFIITLLFLYFILSFVPASQRYIALSIPILIIIFTVKIKRSDLIFNILFFFPINLFLLANQYCTGVASFNIIKYIQEKNIINITCAGAVGPHMNNFFPYYNRQELNCLKLAKYKVVEGYNEEAIYRSSFYLKTYSIVKVN
jgi:hypothetical protein